METYWIDKVEVVQRQIEEINNRKLTLDDRMVQKVPGTQMNQTLNTVSVLPDRTIPAVFDIAVKSLVQNSTPAIFTSYSQLSPAGRDRG